MKKLLIWGTGDIAVKVMENGLNGEILGFIETVKKTENFMGKMVYSIDELSEDYDFIVVANTYGNEIYQECINKGIDLEKVIFLKGVRIKAGNTDADTIKDILGENNFTDYCSEFRLFKDSFLYKDMEIYSRLNTRENFKVDEQYLWPEIRDKYAQAGTIGNYFWQDLWAAKLICKSGVTEHFDIGSRIDGFIAHLLAADIDVTLIDIREFPIEVKKLHTIIDDATSLSQVEDDSIESMSVLCSLEYFGLGRYGNPIDPEACFKCFS